MAALLAPAALIVGLALAGGGFDVTARHEAGLIVWLVVVGLLVLGAGSGARLAWPLYLVAGLIVGLALLSALSSLWSGSVELSVIEADRVLVYLGFFLAAFLIAQTEERRERFAEGMAIGMALVVILGLGSRLLPHVMNVSDSLGTGPRLRYPLGYWNANGAMAGMATAMLLWTSRHGAWSWLRWASAALIPAMLLTLYFAYSRGGLVALVVASGALLALSRDRLWLLATLAIGALGALPAVLAVQARHSLADNLASQAAVDQGRTVFLILLGGIALALALYALLRFVESREGRWTGRMVELSRHPTLLRTVAAALAVLAIGAAVAVGGRAWDQFSSSDIQFPKDPSQHFSEVNGAGRHDFWRVALDSFDEKPVLGYGAGTYVFLWTKHRSIEMPVHDAHSLYLEPLAELGIVGGLIVIGLIGSLLWVGLGAWRAAPHPRREAYAALFAVMLAFAVGAAFDWFWEIADMGALLFLAGGVLVSVRCAQISASRRREGGTRRYVLAIAGLAAAWLSAVALIGPLLVEHELTQSRADAAKGDLPGAVDHADTARSIEPFAASPYVQLGLLADLQSEFANAAGYFTNAIEREEDNWKWYYLRSEARHLEGNEAAAQADLKRAQQLNPQAVCLFHVGWVCQ